MSLVSPDPFRPSLASPDPLNPLGNLTPEEVERRRKKAIAEMQSAMNAPPNPHGSIGGLTDEEYRESLARAQASENSAKATHSTMDPTGHQLMFGPIAPGQGGVGGGVLDGLQVGLGTSGALKLLPGAKLTSPAHKASNAVNEVIGTVANRALGAANPLMRKAVGKAAVSGTKKAADVDAQDAVNQYLFNLASILGG